jgi:hypothetical protein
VVHADPDERLKSERIGLQASGRDREESLTSYSVQPLGLKLDNREVGAIKRLISWLRKGLTACWKSTPRKDKGQ